MLVFHDAHAAFARIGEIGQGHAIMAAFLHGRGQMQELPGKVLMDEQDLHAPNAACINARV